MAELLTFVLGDVFGIVTLFVGIAIGIWLGRLWASMANPAASSTESDSDKDSEVYRDHLEGVIKFTTHFSGDLTKHIEMLENLEHKLAEPENGSSGEDDGPSTKAVELIAQITAANQKLKQRLESAEATLKSQAQELEDTLSEARTDALTQLLNRRAFDEERKHRWALWERKKQPYSLLMLDIDHFKQVNDQYGHDAGDKVLTEVAARLSAIMRQTDYLARIGGEELAVLLPESDASSIVAIAKKVLNTVRSLPVTYGDSSIQVTVSLGLMAANHAESSSALMKGADEALYAAKKAGRNGGFLNVGEALVPIEDHHPEPKPAQNSPGNESPTTSDSESQANAVMSGNALDNAASELRNRLFQISQGF